VAEPNSVKPLPPIWRRRRWLLSGGGVLLFVAAVLWLLSVPPGGFWEWTGIDGKTAWDLADLLIVPLALAFVAFILSWRQKQFELEQARADREAEQERARAERENERQIARHREEDAALNMFYDRMSDLLLSHNLRDSDETAEERSIARARTLTILRRLSPERKAALVQFLFEAGLILAQKTVIPLHGADLEEAEFGGADLRGIDLQEAIMPNAFLAWVNLQGSNLRGIILEGARLSGAKLGGADLRGAFLGGAELSRVRLEEANLQRAHLRGADLRRAHLRGADLRGAFLGEADLRGAFLGEADLRGANLQGADLGGAFLKGADLRGAGYDKDTHWPDGYVPPSDAVNVDNVQNTDRTAQPDGADSPAHPIAAAVEPDKTTPERAPEG
jgi:uncharacterized protein YjbI with pentapeptide repeats